MVKTRVHVFVSGIVQGVFFRQKTKQQAESLGVIGWIRNLPDGRVEAVFEGEEDVVNTLVKFCRKGPKGASVTGLIVNRDTFRDEFESFEIV